MTKGDEGSKICHNRVTSFMDASLYIHFCFFLYFICVCLSLLEKIYAPSTPGVLCTLSLSLLRPYSPTPPHPTPFCLNNLPKQHHLSRHQPIRHPPLGVDTRDAELPGLSLRRKVTMSTFIPPEGVNSSVTHTGILKPPGLDPIYPAFFRVCIYWR